MINIHMLAIDSCVITTKCKEYGTLQRVLVPPLVGVSSLNLATLDN